MSRRWVLILITVLYLPLAGCANMVLLHPSRNKIAADSAEPRKIPTGTGYLEVLVDRSPACGQKAPAAYVLAFTGNAGRAESFAASLANKRWCDVPVEVWMVNYPGFGSSSGEATLDAIVPAAMDAYDAIREVAGERPIFLDANSFGSAVGLYVATQRPVSGLIMKNPPPLREILLEHHGWWNLFLITGPLAMQVPPELQAVDTAPNVTVPAAFLMAEGDMLVPPRYQQYVQDAYGGPKTIIRMPEASHMDLVDDRSERKIRKWIHQVWDQTFPSVVIQ